MITTSVKIDGDKVLQVKLDLLAEGADPMAFEEIRRSVANVWQAAKTSSPRITGELADSIEIVEDREEIAANVGTNKFYAPWVHFGTKRIRANPFLFNASEAEVPNLIAALTARMRGLIDRVSGGGR